MSYTIELLPGEPILLSNIHADFNVGQELLEAVNQLTRMLDAADGQLYYVTKLENFSLSFGDMVQVLSRLTSGDLAFMKHPNLYKVVVVANNDLIRLGSNALSQTQYGGVRVDVFDSLEEALASVRDELAV